MTISKVGMLCPKGHSTYAFIAADSLQKGSREIGEGKSESYLVDETDIGFSSDKYVAFACDATGRMYWSRGIVKRLITLHRAR